MTLDQLVGLPVAQAPQARRAAVEPEVEAELQAHQARLRQVMQTRCRASMWRAYVEACVALADGLSSLGQARGHRDRSSRGQPTRERRPAAGPPLDKPS